MVVIHAQNFSRKFLEVKAARMRVLLRYWDKLEPQWKANLKKLSAAAKSTEGLDEKSKKSTDKAKKMIKKKKDEAMQNIVIPE
jgi:hypothetical protein